MLAYRLSPFNIFVSLNSILVVLKVIFRLYHMKTVYGILILKFHFPLTVTDESNIKSFNPNKFSFSNIFLTKVI